MVMNNDKVDDVNQYQYIVTIFDNTIMFKQNTGATNADRPTFSESFDLLK